MGLIDNYLNLQLRCCMMGRLVFTDSMDEFDWSKEIVMTVTEIM